jgi:Ca2+-binding RTX toxin-like protein
VDCTLASLASGSATSVTVKVRPTRTGPVDNTASVTSSTTEGAPGDESDTDSLTVETNTKGCSIVGTGGADTITGTGGADVICGMGGGDHLDGAGGADKLYGQAGGDTLVDHSGLDKLLGGGGDDGLDTSDGAAGDIADGQSGTDTCTADPGDTVQHCP